GCSSHLLCIFGKVGGNCPIAIQTNSAATDESCPELAQRLILSGKPYLYGSSYIGGAGASAKIHKPTYGARRQSNLPKRPDFLLKFGTKGPRKHLV
ncbi:MAG: hypothetical protein P8Y71_17850, partial [Pseudolabrys sp.]